MEYKVYYGNALIHDYRDDNLTLINPVVHLEVNTAGTFEFDITVKHPAYNTLKVFDKKIYVYRDFELVFCGRILQFDMDWYKTKHVYCEGVMAMLNDSSTALSVNGRPPSAFLSMLLGAHNNLINDSKRSFSLGTVNIPMSTSSFNRSETGYQKTWEIIEDLAEKYNGYFRVRVEHPQESTETMYLDWMTNFGTATQAIEFGKNLINLENQLDMSDVCSVLIPVGEDGLMLDNVMVTNQTAVNKWGRIVHSVNFDECGTKTVLEAAAENYLNTHIGLNSIEVSAVDLGFTDGVTPFNLGQRVKVVSPYHNENTYYDLVELSIDLTTPANNTITLGQVRRSLTQKVVATK